MPAQKRKKGQKMKTGSQPAGKYTAGYNSTIKLLKNKEAEKVLLAYDCSEFIKQNVLSAAEEADTEVDTKNSMSELGAMCGIDVGCAVCAIRKS